MFCNEAKMVKTYELVSPNVQSALQHWARTDQVALVEEHEQSRALNVEWPRPFLHWSSVLAVATVNLRAFCDQTKASWAQNKKLQCVVVEVEEFWLQFQSEEESLAEEDETALCSPD